MPRHPIFLLGKNRKPIRRQILEFSETEIENRNAHLSQLGAISRPGNGDFESSPPAQHPPFYGAAEGGQLCLLFDGSTARKISRI